MFTLLHAVHHHPPSSAALHVSKYWGTVISGRFGLKKSKESIRRCLATGTVAGFNLGGTDSSDASSPSKIIINATKKWVDSIVIDEELCPFVSPLKKSDAIRYVSSNASTLEQAIHSFEVEAKMLLKGYENTRSTKNKLSEETNGLIVHQSPEIHQKSSTHRVTLISFHGPFVSEFEDFDILCELINHNVLIERKYFDILAVMNFHPQYFSFYDKKPPKINDSFYFPRRSPFPTMLLVPESDMQSAWSSDKIGELCVRNKIKFIEQGIKKCQSRLRSCYDPASSKREPR